MEGDFNPFKTSEETKKEEDKERSESPMFGHSPMPIEELMP